MYQANSYVRNNSLQRRDINEVLANSLKLMKWQSDGSDVLLDVGCGSGDVTKDVLLAQIPKFKRILGVDISKEMLNYAMEHNSHEKIDYMFMDIADRRPLRTEFIEQFDHAFSFHVFHWVRDQIQAFNNISQMLKPGGDMLMLFSTSSDVMIIYDRMSEMTKWKKYMHNVNEIFPYHYLEKPINTLEKILNNSGLAHVVKIEEKEFIYETKQEFLTSMSVINPFLKQIPEELHDEFMDEFGSIAGDLNFYPNHEDHEDLVVVPYKLAVIYLRKPEY